MELKPFQQKAVTRIRNLFSIGKQRILLSLPTGAGKTVCFSYMATESAKRGRRVLILTDRKELLTQSGNTISEFGIEPFFIKDSKYVPEYSGVTVMMVKTFFNYAKRKPELYSMYDFVIVDECHRGDFREVIANLHKKVFLLGVTATPISANKKFPLYDQYEEIVDTISISRLIEEGNLVAPLTYSIELDKKGLRVSGSDYSDKTQLAILNKRKVHSKTVEKWLEIASGKRTICFCVNIEDSKKTVDEFISAGISARHVDAKSVDREDIFKAHKNGEFQVLCNVGIATAGYDDPKIECVIVKLITQSLTKWLQMVGRGGRSYKGKKDFILMDMGANYEMHGLWEDERDWQYLFHNPKVAGEGIAPRKVCKQCEALILATANKCEYCGYIIPKKYERIGFIEKEITLIKKKANANIPVVPLPKVPREEWGNLDLLEIKRLYTARTYALGWVVNVLKVRENPKQQIRDFAKLMGYKYSWVKRMVKNYNVR